MLLCRFAAGLEEIWLAAGKPSYRDLEKLDPQLPKSTISDVLRGKTAPSDRFLRAFIRVCRKHSQRSGRHADSAIFDEQAWFENWRQLQRDLRELRRRRPAAVPATARRATGEPVHNRYSLACPAGCAEVDGDVAVLTRVLDALRRMTAG